MQDEPLDLDVPRNAGELIATTLVLFVRHAALFLAVTVLVVAPVELLVTGVWAGGFSDGGDADVPVAPFVATGVLSVLMPVLVTALHVVIVRDLGDGRVPAVGHALRAAAPSFPRAIGAVVVYTLLTVGGMVLLLVPGIWVLVAGYFVAQAAVMEDRGPFAAFRRSTQLIEDRWWRTAGTLALAWVLLTAVAFPVGLAVDAVDSGVVYVALYTLVEVLTLSLTALFGTLMYFSLRARKERGLGYGPAGAYLPPTPAADRPGRP